MRISDWSSDVCSSDLLQAMGNDREKALALYEWNLDLSSALIVPLQVCEVAVRNGIAEAIEHVHGANWPWNNGFIRSLRSEEHTSELQSLMRISYAVFCLKKTKIVHQKKT